MPTVVPEAADQPYWQSYVIFIVRDDRQADFIFQCSDTTWQAYNRWPSQFSLYDDGRNEWYWGNQVAVSFNRPYGKYCQILDAQQIGHCGISAEPVCIACAGVSPRTSGGVAGAFGSSFFLRSSASITA